MRKAGDLRRELAAAPAYSAALARKVADYLESRRRLSVDRDAEAVLFESLFRQAEATHPGFVYLAWRDPDGRCHCSLALDESDLDRHSWSGQGATPSLALASALVASLAAPEQREVLLLGEEPAL